MKPSPHNSDIKTLAFAEERARLAIESAELGVYELDLLNNTMQSTPRMDEIFGFSTPADRTLYLRTVHPEDLPIRNTAQAEAMLSGHLLYESRIIWPDNSIHWIKVTGTVFYEGGKPTTLLGMVQDITEQKESSESLSRLIEEKTRDLMRTNQELQNINAELQQYVQVSSHDLQEPLRKIQIYSEMIMKRDHERLTEASKSHFQKINEAAARLSTSLKDLLNFNSINKDDQFVQIDITDIIKMAESDLELVIAQKSAVLRYDRLPVIRAIPLQMHQLFYNLINNALKFSRSETAPEIAIRMNKLSSQNALHYHHLDGSKKYIEVIVSDNGIGFDQHNAEKIFNMFQRLHDRRQFSGTGIGLALCRKVVQNHAGKIWASSAPGKGASFHIILPTG